MRERIADYSGLLKLRLSFLVVFSAAMGYLFGNNPGTFDLTKFLLLLLAGFLVTGSSNGFNQIIEKDLDKLMSRTEGRPLPSNRISRREAFYLSLILGIIGLLILFFFINFRSFILGAFALLSYTLAYTPLKKKTPFAVFIGAFPGAIPPMLGYVAARDQIDLAATILFFLQFIWQFPHFWAIAWVLDEDYKKAGFKMLPSGQRDKASAFQAFVYALGLLPLGWVPYMFHLVGLGSAIIIFIAGIVFTIQARQLYKNCEIKDATRLMFGSFVYLPVIQIALVLGKL